MEAAKRAYDQTRGTTAATVAEAQGGPEAIITWYCYAIWSRAALYGRRCPSQKLQQISLEHKSAYSFKADTNAVVLEDRHGGGRFEDLQILLRELPQVIAVIGAWGKSKEERAE